MNRTQPTTKKVPGGTVTVTGPGSNGLTRSQTKANQRWWERKDRKLLVSASPGRFKGGTPSNGLTTAAARRLLARSYGGAARRLLARSYGGAR